MQREPMQIEDEVARLKGLAENRGAKISITNRDDGTCVVMIKRGGLAADTQINYLWVDEGITVQPKPRPEDDDGGFEPVREAVRGAFERHVANGGGPLFLVSHSKGVLNLGLHDIFLAGLPEDLRQHYNCNCCRSFVNHYGALATISEDGRLSQLLWPEAGEAPLAFREATRAVRNAVEAGEVESVFVTAEQVLGTPTTGPWTHLHALVPPALRCRGPLDLPDEQPLKTPAQIMAEKREDRGMLLRGLQEFPIEIVRTALAYLTGGDFYRSEKAVAMMTWLLALYEKLPRTAGPNPWSKLAESFHNQLWLAAATAPMGFCHVKSGMVGTLLEDIQAGYQMEAIKARWAQKMDPANYQRAQTAPSAGNIAAAEKVIQRMQAVGSLDRRFALLDEIPRTAFLWRGISAPRNPVAPGGIFANIKPKVPAAPPTDGTTAVPGEQTITFSKLLRTVLPNARGIELLVPRTSERFVGLVTASHPSAPPILQWDADEERNPFSWFYAGGGIDGEIQRRVLQAGGMHAGVDIRFSLLWNDYSDLDLHVHSPHGYTWYGDKRHGLPGWLDVDMNIAPTTMQPVENIRWARDEAKVGHYKVWVRNYTPRKPGGSPFRVEMEIQGQIYHFDDIASARMGRDTPVAEFYYTGGRLERPPIGVGVRASACNVSEWGLQPGSYVKVTGILPSPNMWGATPHRNQGEHTFFLLDGCRDSTAGKGRGFLTEMLRAEFHPIRSVLEAYTAQTDVAGATDATACGVGMSNGGAWNLRLRVNNGLSVVNYFIDRLD